MASIIDRIKNDLLEAINASQRKTSPYDTEAEVVRIEGNTAWVYIGGGVAETPVALTINAQKGDKVQVRVSNEGAWITGNATAPPTDDARAIVAERKAVVAETKAIEAKEESAEAVMQATEAKADATEAVIKANGSVASDTIHYLATSASSGVTVDTQGWTTTIQTIDSQKRYLWTYHTYTKANGATTNTQPVITGTFGVDGTSVTILGSYNTLAELQTAHPTGQLGDAYMVAGDLYVWNGTAWENVGQIQGPKGDTGAQGPKGDTGEKGDKGDKGDRGATGATGAQGPTGPAGQDGAKGDTGTSVTQVINYYLATPANSGITRESTGWTTTIQTMTATNQYLWNYEIVKGTGNVTLNTTDPIIIGRYGQNGTNGISVTAVQPQYALSTSTSTAPTSGWGNTLVYEEGKYIWTRDEITYSNGNIGHSTAIYNSALTSACVNALNALQIAEDTNQYFWHTESGTDTGAHITEIPQEDFIADPQNGGGNMLARSNGIAVRDGLMELATFGANGSQIGLDDEARTITTPTSTEWYSDETTLAGAIYHSPTEKTTTTTTSGTMSGMSYGWWDVPTISIDVLGGVIQLNFSGEITENDRHQEAIGTFNETKTFDFNGYDKDVDGGYYASYSFTVALSSGNSETFYLVLWETGTISIGLRERLPNTVYSMDFWGIMSYISELSYTLSRIGEKVLFGQADDDDIIARATNIHNELRVGNYGLINYDENTVSPLITVGNGTDDEHRANAFTVDSNGNVDIASGSHYKIDGAPINATGVFTYQNNTAIASSNLSANSTFYLPSQNTGGTYTHYVNDTSFYEIDHNGFKTTKAGMYHVSMSGHLNSQNAGVQGFAIQIYDWTSSAQVGYARFAYTEASWSPINLELTVPLAAGHIIVPRVERYSGSTGRWKITNLQFTLTYLGEGQYVTA